MLGGVLCCPSPKCQQQQMMKTAGRRGSREAHGCAVSHRRKSCNFLTQRNALSLGSESAEDQQAPGLHPATFFKYRAVLVINYVPGRHRTPKLHSVQTTDNQSTRRLGKARRCVCEPAASLSPCKLVYTYALHNYGCDNVAVFALASCSWDVPSWVTLSLYSKNGAIGLIEGLTGFLKVQCKVGIDFQDHRCCPGLQQYTNMGGGGLLQVDTFTAGRYSPHRMNCVDCRL